MSRCSRVNRRHWYRRRNVAAHSGIVTATAVPALGRGQDIQPPADELGALGHRQHTVAAHLVAAQRILEGIKPTQSCTRMIWLVAAAANCQQRHRLRWPSMKCGICAVMVVP